MAADPAYRDQVMPDGAWTFDETVTDVFDEMLERSIPQYVVMRETVAQLSERFMRAGTSVLDLGTSRGEALARLNPSAHDKPGGIHFVGVEVSDPMLAAARDRFGSYRNVSILNHDLRGGLPDWSGLTRDGVTDALSVCQAVLTLMFVPIEHRARLVRSVYDRLTDGGAFIVVEKVLGDTAPIDDVLVDLYLDGKRARGYTEDQIARKRMALEGVLVPVTAEWNADMLRRAGFRQVDAFWRWGPFCGWLAIKE